MKTATFFIALYVIFFTPTEIFGYGTGISGYSGKATNVCTKCHGSISSAVTLTITGPTTLTAGATGNYTLTVASSSISKSGVDIAASSGTLAANDAQLKLLSSDLTHSSTKSGTGSVTWKFLYTAPATTGSATLYASGGTSKSAINKTTFAVTVTDATDVKESGAKVTEYRLLQNYPNPFNPSTKISYAIAKDEYVTLNVYNVAGKEVERLVNGQRSAGEYSVSFNASELPSGVYFYKLTAGSFTQIKKMVLTK